jgi:hypothetical protein
VRWIAITAVLAMAPAAAAAQPRALGLEVSPLRGSMNDTFTVSVRLEVAGVGGPERYRAPSFGRDFKVIDEKRHLSRSLSADPSAARLVMTHLYVYTLKPRRPGRHIIRGARVRIAGKEYETDNARVMVYDSDDAVPRTGGGDPTAGGIGAPGFEDPRVSGDPEAFIHVVTDKKDPYLGEQVTVTWLLYSKSEVLSFDPRPPPTSDLWSEILYEATSFFRYFDARVGGSDYLVTPLAKRAMFATRAGPVEVKPFVARIATLASTMARPEEIESPILRLSVKPLPPNPPPDFDPSYVGVFDVEASLDRTAARADEALTLEVTVRAEGAIRRTTAPVLHFPGFDFGEPRDFEESVDTATEVVRGIRTYRYWTTPSEGGAQTIPPIRIHYFNPRSERYEVATTDEIPVEIRGEPTAAAAAASKRGRPIDRDIRLIREGETVSTRGTARWYHTGWFWLVSLLPLLSFVGVVVGDRVRQRMRRETPRARLRRARGRARQRFRVAEIHLRGNRPPKFFGELVRILYDYIEERCGRPVQSMTRDELAEYLRGRGFAANTVKRITADLDVFDMARFAPSATAVEEMRAALRRVKALLREIERARLSGEEGREDDS